MKRIFIPVIVSLLSLTAIAQTDPNRTARTKVSDVLALLPAKDNLRHQWLMADLASTGTQGVDILTEMFDRVDNVPVNNALAGWAVYVAESGDEQGGKVFSEGIVNALDKITDIKIKEFYIHLLGIAGKDECVSVLSGYIGGELTEPAVRALVAINTEGARSVIEDAVIGQKADKAILALAVGDMPVKGIEEGLTDWLPNADTETKQAIYYAIARIGTLKAMPILYKAVENADFADEPTKAVQAYVYMLERFVNEGYALQKTATDAKLMADKALAKKEYATALAGLNIYASIVKQDVVPIAIRAVNNSPSREYRAGVLRIAEPFMPKEGYEELVYIATKAKSTEVKVDIIEFIGESKFGYLNKWLEPFMYDQEEEVVIATTYALSKLGGDSFVPLAANLVSRTSDNIIEAIRQALIAYKVEPELDFKFKVVVMACAKENYDKGCVAALSVLAERRIVESTETVIMLTASEDKAISTAAYKALPYLIPIEGMYDMAKKTGNAEAINGYIYAVSNSDDNPERKVLMLSDAIEIARTAEQKREILEQAARLPIFQSMILAGGYLDDEDSGVKQSAAETVVKIVSANEDLYGPVVTRLLEKAETLIGVDNHLLKRKALTEGYVSMFNGRDLTGWKGLVENPILRNSMPPSELAAKQTEADKIMRQEWVVKDGTLVFEGKGYQNICTEKQYGDFEMYVDWKLYPDGPEADGGIYLRGSPQVQMWDIARTNVGAQVGSGGLYNNQANRSTPLTVADNEMGKWNTFYIKMVGERVTVVLNGEKVVDNVIMENYWDRSQPIFPVEQIELQAHGTRVAYRNMYVRELQPAEPYVLSPEEQEAGFEVLFDGVSMNKWVGNTTDYVAENGAIVLYPENGSGGNLYTKDLYDDFVIRFEFMLTPGANNGLGIRTPSEGDAAYVGMELQILDNDAPIYSELEKWQYHGSVYGVIPAKRGALKPLGEWNYQEVYAKGDHIRIVLNGEVILDGNIREAAKNGTIDGKDHPGLFNKEGYIAFLGHGSVVKFKNIRIKKLK